ncbi:MAG: type II TA system antitoxin MqsA family protein [Verrucomicrobiota bacterium]
MKAARKKFEALPDTPQVLPSECLKCGSGDAYIPRVSCDTVEFRTQKFTVEYERMECPACGHSLLSDDQADARLKKTVAAYQRANQMLTAAEVAERRRALGLSQRDLADRAPEIAEATLKRIEGGLNAQNKSTDALIRLCLDRLERQAIYEWVLQVDRQLPVDTEGPTHTYHFDSTGARRANREPAATISEGFSFYIRPYRVDAFGSCGPLQQGCAEASGESDAGEEQFAMAV